MSDQPRAYTEEELRELFMKNIWSLIRYWQNAKANEETKVSGVVHSVLALLDGMSGSFPAAFHLVADVHPDDQEYNESMGQNWVEPGTKITKSILLNDIMYEYEPE